MTLSATDMTFLLVLFAAFPFVFFATEMTLSATDMTFLLVFSACVVCCIYLVFVTDDIVCYRHDISACVVCYIYVLFPTEMTLSAKDMTFLLVLFATFMCCLRQRSHCLLQT